MWVIFVVNKIVKEKQELYLNPDYYVLVERYVDVKEKQELYLNSTMNSILSS